MTERGEIRLLHRAIKERWPVSEEQRQKVVDRLLKVINDADSEDGKAILAARALIAADAINMEAEQRELDRRVASGPQLPYAERIIDADPEISRLECEIAARRSALRNSEPDGIPLVLREADEITSSLGPAELPSANGRGHS